MRYEVAHVSASDYGIADKGARNIDGWRFYNFEAVYKNRVDWVALAWIDDYAIFVKYAFVVAPFVEYPPVVTAYDKFETFVFIPLAQQIESVDCI